jgi:adenine C2-methylase RlmN of 23S rRNA A2503 and tRNA A37
VEIKNFANLLYQAGVMVITRKSQGSDILAACGQLAYSFQKNN